MNRDLHYERETIMRKEKAGVATPAFHFFRETLMNRDF